MPRNPWQEIQIAQQRRTGHLENSARPANLFVTYETVGSGQLIPKDPVMFAVPFFHEPAVIHGHTLTRPPQDEYYSLPRSVNGGVYRWVQNQRGFYLGCHLYFHVDVPLIPCTWPTVDMPPANPVVAHHFTFMGEAYKVMGDQVNDSIALDESVEPLRPPLVP